MRNMLGMRNIRLVEQMPRRWTIELAPEKAGQSPAGNHGTSSGMIQAILGTRANLVGQGTAVGKPLGIRQVAVMILGFVPICCRIPARRLCLGKAPVPRVES